MAELEIHHEEHVHDEAGKRVGILAALLAVCLAIVTITSHRTHTEAIIRKSEANDAWQYYQASRLKFHNLELGERLLGSLGGTSPAAHDALDRTLAEERKYTEQGKDLQEKARSKDEQSEAAERRALRYDLGEGLLEIAVVLTSMYFISRKNLFPVIGIIAGVSGIVIAVTGLVV